MAVGYAPTAKKLELDIIIREYNIQIKAQATWLILLEVEVTKYNRLAARYQALIRIQIKSTTHTRTCMPYIFLLKLLLL